MKFQINHNFLITVITIFTIFSKSNAKLISFQSEYEISNIQKEEARIPGKTYVDKASGYLLIDWLNSCQNSWVSNQRMMTRFINSHGVGTLSEINYSLNEMNTGEKMDFVLEIKENAEVQERFYGMAKRIVISRSNLNKEKQNIIFQKMLSFLDSSWMISFQI